MRTCKVLKGIVALVFLACLPYAAQASTFTILHQFADGSVANDGMNPWAGLTLGTDGNYYGTTTSGGSTGEGAVFQMTPTGSITLLHSFGDGSVPNDGSLPEAGLVQGSDGYLYGTTHTGGAFAVGALFRVATDGSNYAVLHSFGSSAIDGAYPSAGVVEGVDGDYYGTTTLGGDGGIGGDGLGVVYKSDTFGIVTILHSFQDGTVLNDGAEPDAALVLSTDGNFYGTTESGGDADNGALFRITAAGVVTTMHSFFDGAIANDGADPVSALIQASDGKFYGTTTQGGTEGEISILAGTVFSMTQSGDVTILHSFNDGSVPNDGNYPNSALLEGSDGNFYSTTQGGGDGPDFGGDGTIFSMTPSGAITILHSFADGSVANDGAAPYAPLIESPDATFLGTTYYGGAAPTPLNGSGTSFSIGFGLRLMGPHVGAAGPVYVPPADPVEAFPIYGSQFTAGTQVVTPNGQFFPTAFEGPNEVVAFVPSSVLSGNTFAFSLMLPGGTLSNFFQLRIANPVSELRTVTPGSVIAGFPTTITVHGSHFAQDSTINWGGTALTTLFVSKTELQATLTPAFTESGIVEVQVDTPLPGGGPSGRLREAVMPTTLHTTSTSVSRDPNTDTITAVVSLHNSGYYQASSVQVTAATLGTVATTTSLPLAVGSITAGSSGSATLSFSGSAGMKGLPKYLNVSGTFASGGVFESKIAVKLP